MEYPFPCDYSLARCQLLGEVGAGKSSFINSVDSVIIGYVAKAMAETGESEYSVTDKVLVKITIKYVINYLTCSKRTFEWF